MKNILLSRIVTLLFECLVFSPGGKIKDPNLYMCPIYKKPKRTDLTFITSVFLKTSQQPEHWIMRAVALLCDIK